MSPCPQMPLSLCHDPVLMPKAPVPERPCPPVPADGLYLPCPRCEAPSPGSRGGGLGPRLPRASVSLCHRAPTCARVPEAGTLPLPASPPWGPHREATAPPELQARSTLGQKRHQKSRRPRGAAISPGVPRETPLVLTAALRYSAERPFPGGPRPTDVPPPNPVPRGGTPPNPPETDSISMDTEHQEGREGAGWERAGGRGGRRLGGRGVGAWAGGVPSPAEGTAPRGSARPRRGCA